MITETGFGVSIEVIKHSDGKVLTTITNDLCKMERVE